MGAVTLLSAMSLSAQETALGAYSLYTFYGIGDISEQGPTYLRSMGGASAAYRSSNMLNYTNPASYSAVSRNTFIFNVGLEQQNFYEKSATTSSSFNSFNLRNAAFEFPVAKKMGVGISIAPYSSVGYRLSIPETDPDVLADVGHVSYRYFGEGGVSQIKIGAGYELVKNLSVGANMVYYRGYISRSFSTSVTNITGVPYYYDTEGEATERISSISAEFGMQYVAVSNTNTRLTFGATYSLGGKMHNKSYRFIPSSNMASDTLYYDKYNMGFELPSTLTVGVNLQKRRYMVAADYEFKDWGSRNEDDVTSQRTFRNTNAYKFGFQYTPNPGDIRSIVKRTSYRVGVRRSDYYMNMYGEEITDQALTFGLGIPLRRTNLSNLNLGVEWGQRGSTAHGLYKDTYVKFSAGLNFFGEDYWFVKLKYD